MTSPLQIEIALHYRCRTTDYGLANGDNNFGAPAVVEQRQKMIDAGLLVQALKSDPFKRHYQGTPTLARYVDALCEVPWPHMPSKRTGT